MNKVLLLLVILLASLFLLLVATDTTPCSEEPLVCRVKRLTYGTRFVINRVVVINTDYMLYIDSNIFMCRVSRIDDGRTNTLQGLKVGEVQTFKMSR